MGAAQLVAINFQPEFVEPIRSGAKTQTIRRSARCKTGDELQLYTGQRTKACRQIGTATCAICEPITIADDYISVGMFRLPSGDAAHMAQIDGFKNLASMRDWFRDRYGALPFNGYRIMWNNFKDANILHQGPANMVLACGGRELTNGTTTIRVQK